MTPPDSTIDAIYDVHLTAATAEQIRSGVLAFASVLVGDWRIDSLVVRRTRNGQVYLDWPTRRSGSRQYPVVMPTSATLKKAVESAVLAAWESQP